MRFDMAFAFARLWPVTNIQLNTAKQVYAFIRPQISLSQEEMWVIALSGQLEVIGARCLFRGTVDHCIVHPRDVFRYAYETNATRIIISHSHPSGQVLPSKEDLDVTEDLVKVGALMKIPIEDHVIVTAEKYFSFKEKGLV
jgi:DNA repair protein RadC